MLRELCKVFLIIGLCAGAVTPLWAMSVLPLSLDQIVTDAGVVFQGICTGNHTETDGANNLVVTYSSFSVQEILKGSVGSQHTIKQVGGSTDVEGRRVSGATSFAVGEEYVVFLYGVSAAGFSSPVGLGQGQFIVRNGPNGKVLSNGRPLKELIPGLAVAVPNPSLRSSIAAASADNSFLGLEDFKEIVRQRLGGAR
jgi:hypothetical protein